MVNKIKVSALELITAVSWVTKDLTENSNGSAPVVLEALTDGSVSIWHNSVTYLRKGLAVESMETGDKDISVLMDGKFLKRFGSAIKPTDGEVVLSFSKEGKSVLAKTKSARFNIPIINGRVPAAPEVISLGEIDDSEFFSALTRMSKLCDASSNNSFLASVSIDIKAEDNKVSMFATDRYALGEIIMDFETEDGVDEDYHILLPSLSASMVAPSKGASTPVSLVVEKSKGDDGEVFRFGYEFVDSRIALFSLSMVAPFTGLQNMKDGASKGTDNSIVLSKAELSNAVKTVSSLSWNSNEVYVTLDKGLKVADPAGDTVISVGHTEMETTGEHEGAYKFRFVIEVIQEALATVMSANVKLKWSDDGSTFLFLPLTETGAEEENFFLMCISTKED